MIGGAEAAAIEAVGKAEAERMRLKASAYKQYGDAAMLSLVLETLPKVCILLLDQHPKVSFVKVYIYMLTCTCLCIYCKIACELLGLNICCKG